ncbi:MAG: helix-turn-helix transcriptional regulator [candidate division WOR-3 bacterium]|nr:helix-turn-helix transcriptional regulator [candidate division WOR-3 bacterium]
MDSRADSVGSDAALLPKEVGARLRQLRREAGLTQADVALRMCRPGPSGKSYVCQIERGYMPGLTFNAVMDFLRACGAKVSAIEDIFDAYTSRPPIPEEQTRRQVAEAAVGLPTLKRARVEWYDIFHKPKTGKRETPEQEYGRRVREARGQVRAIRWERRLHRVFNDVLNELGLGCSDPLAVLLMTYGRKVFGVLRRTRTMRPVWRKKAVAKLDKWAVGHELPPEPFTRMKQAITVLFAEMELRGELD